MSEDSPKIVSLETSLELSEFPSEAEFSSEAEFPTEKSSAAQVAPVADITSPVTAAAVAPLPAPPLVETPAPIHVIAATPPPPVTPMPAVVSRESVDDSPDVEEPIRQPSHFGPAVVTEFPVKPQASAAVVVPTLAAGPVSLVELIERRGGFDWREAVAVIQQICLYLRDQSPQTPILLDPRTIQITERGEVRLLSGQTSSDPLVIQVGRLMRTMLMGKDVPPELRLLLSQATFELPIFESIEDVNRALAQLSKLDEPGPAGLALLRAVAAPPPPPDPEQDFDQRPPPIRSILPANRVAGRRGRSRTGRSLLGGYGTHVAVIFAAIATIAILLVTRPSFLFTEDSASTSTGQLPPIEPANAPAAPTQTSGSSAPEPAPLSGSGTPGAEGSRRVADSAGRTHAPVVPPTGSRARETTPGREPDAPRSGSSRPENRPLTTTIVIPPRVTPTASARESERRARELLEVGKADEASLAFDNLVMNNPLYEPRTTDLTPEALAAFRRSQRLILPVKAQRDYDLAKSAFANGDYDTAVRLAREAMAILDRHPAGARAELREDAQDLIDEAQLASALATEVIYNEGDPGITPPRQLSRQMPVAGPSGIPPNRVGWLDLVVGKDGTVVNVKLTTPLNRYHERMIVSPAKAWQFRPATRNGKAVLCRIRVKVNLPESGTDDYPF